MKLLAAIALSALLSACATENTVNPQINNDPFSTYTPWWAAQQEMK